MYKSIIFDMDGTLLDSSYAMTCSVNHVRKQLGLPPVDKEFLEYHINQPDENIAMKFYEVKEYLPLHRELFREHYLANSALHVKPYDGAHELLTFLKSSGATLSIATNASDFFAKHMLGFCEMSDFFTHIIGANNVEKSKPNPDMIDLLINATSIGHKDTILVGDSLKDEGAAINANIDFAFADWGYGTANTTKNRFTNIDGLHNFFKKVL